MFRAVVWTAMSAAALTSLEHSTHAAERPAPDAPASGDVSTWVDQKVAACAPKPQERRFDQTGWLTDIRSALALAEKHNRPIFLFTHDGRMGLGRC